MSSVVKVDPRLPASVRKLAALATPETFDELTGGVMSGFPVISIKGKVWRIRKSGEETLHVDANGDALPSIEVVLVQAHPLPSKIFYEKQYEEGSTDLPTCFSNDGIKPDATAPKKINPVCATCPNNMWGSKITPAGKKTKACADARRMAVVFAQDLLANGKDAEKYLLRVPPASLNPLKDYAEKVLKPKGIPFYGIVTRIGFDVQAAHPQMVFKPARFVNDDEADAIAALRGSEDVRRILAEASEFPVPAAAEADDAESAATTGVPPVAPSVATPAAGSAPAASAKATTARAGTAPTPGPGVPPASGSVRKPRPATDEEAGLAAAKPTAKVTPIKPPAPAEEEIAPAPAPAKRRPAAAKPPVQAAEPTPVEEAIEEAATPSPPAAAPEGFDDLLDTILNG